MISLKVNTQIAIAISPDLIAKGTETTGDSNIDSEFRFQSPLTTDADDPARKDDPKRVSGQIG